MEKVFVRESVRSLVEFILKTGSIDNRFASNKRALEGTLAHQKIQEENKKLYTTYEKEVYLKFKFELKELILEVEGRADGIIYENESIIIEEIKSTYKSLEEIENTNEAHNAQLKFYAYIYAMENDLEVVDIQLTYYQLEVEKTKSFRESIKRVDLEEYVLRILEEYKSYFDLISKYKEARDHSIRNIVFPFKNYREGQLKFVKAVYGTIREGETMFVQAPTGIGKTISTIFPSIKALEREKKEAIYYLTAKGINGKVAVDTLDLLRKKGLVLRSLSIMAKEKICLNDRVACNPEECEYARGYYDKNKKVIKEFLGIGEHISSEKILEISKIHKVCPFELSLDLISWCDCIICDYNYIFDPRVAIRRIEENDNKNNILLIDECHNLVERGRDMYSATLNKEKIMKLRKEVKGKDLILYNILGKINNCFVDFRKECEEIEREAYYTSEIPDEIFRHLRRFMGESEEKLKDYKDEEFIEAFMEVYFEINKFLNISEIYGEDYVTYIQKFGNDVTIKLFCVDPSEKIGKILKSSGGSILFSATISPMKYYVDLILGKEKFYRMSLKSPFKKENLKVIKSARNIRYSARTRTMESVAKDIVDFVKGEKGNYLIFVPSYEYLDLIFEKIKFIDGYKLMLQDKFMSDKDKEEFIETLENERNVVGLCVLGGMFSEGIDLPGEKLIGVVVVGVGFPKISMERDIIKEYFGNKGFDYSYTYPGINKVMQAVGRVIRTEEDKGRALLIDDRYFRSNYKAILPENWYI